MNDDERTIEYEVPSASWQEVDAAIRGLAARRGEYLLEEGRWLLAARDAKVHLRFGFASLVEYVERRLGYRAKTTFEKLRVAEALLELPVLRAALASGARSWSAARELTRVATAETEARWLAATVGKRRHEIEKMVAGRRRGDTPDTPPDPELVPCIVRLELTPEAFARYREVVGILKREVDPHLTDAQALDVMLQRVIDGRGDEERAPYQIALTVCDRCGSATQRGGGEELPVDPVVREEAECDAQHIGRVDPDAPGGTRRASQSIPPAVRRQVIRRDGHRCQVPGCRSTYWIHIHHLTPQEEGGPHHPANLVCLCGMHHGLAHRGVLIIERTVTGELLFRHADGTTYGLDANPAAIDASRIAFSGLRDLGLSETHANALLAHAREHLGPGAAQEALIEHAIQHHGSVVPGTPRASADADVLAGLRSLGFTRSKARALLARAHAEVGATAPAETLLEHAIRASHEPALPAGTGVAREGPPRRAGSRGGGAGSRGARYRHAARLSAGQLVREPAVAWRSGAAAG